MRVEQERLRLLAELEHLIAERDSVFRPVAPRPFTHTDLTRIEFQGNVSDSSLGEYPHHGEHATSPPSSSTSTKIGSTSIEKPTAKRRQLEAVVDRPQKASGPRKSTGKPPAGGTKAQTKTVTNTSRAVKGKGISNQTSLQNPEGSASKGPTQKVIRRVRAVVEVPIKVEDEEEFVHDLVDDRKGTVPSNKDHKPSTAVKKAVRPVQSSRANDKALSQYMDDDATPPAPDPLPKRRKSGIDRDYYEPDEDAYNWRNQGDTNVRHRPPPRRKSIKELRESDFDYREDEGEESDTDELNLGVGFLFYFFPDV